MGGERVESDVRDVREIDGGDSVEDNELRFHLAKPSCRSPVGDNIRFAFGRCS